MTTIYAWQREPRRSLAELHAELLEQRLALLIRQANLKAQSITLDRELGAVEARLAMVELARQEANR